MSSGTRPWPVSDGGTGNAALTTGGVLTGNATGPIVVTSAGNAGQVLTSNGAGQAPTFQASGGGGGGSNSVVNPGTANQIAFYQVTGTSVYGTANLTIQTGNLTVGQSGSVRGVINFSGNTSGGVTVQAAAAAGSWTMTLPTSAGSANQFLQTDGTGVTTWASASGSGIVTSGTKNQVAFYPGTNNSVAGTANLVINTGNLTVGQSGSVLGQINFSGSTSGAVTVAPAATAGHWTMTLPTTGGSANQFLQTDGTGVTTWATPSGSSGAITLITETVTAGSAPSVAFNSIPSTYRDLIVRVRGRGNPGGGAHTVDIRMQMNGDQGANYNWEQDNRFGAGGSAGDTAIRIAEIPGDGATANYSSGASCIIFDYRGTTFFKAVQAYNGIIWTNATADIWTDRTNGNWASTAAISSLSIFPSSGTFVDNSVVSLYGST